MQLFCADPWYDLMNPLKEGNGSLDWTELKMRAAARLREMTDIQSGAYEQQIREI
ncbi:hypothetical protein UY416_25940 [Paenibacillus polymyxa]|uniref:hypothetical protein n=1 Tax=Paenibacillus polymyxa TaxID=1406 RepID=UPI002AB41806|nr:hypothetical protein [Paenibacillus polymyxa]MDY8049718.1 hypothetical protein [Paenibacillus polymyxa]